MRAPDFWRRRGVLSTALLPAAALFTRLAQCRRSKAAPVVAALPVVCVGNIVAGGSGKTPVVIALAEALRREGAAPVILTRGYGGRLTGPVRVDPGRHGASEVGDEALLLARQTPVAVARDRVAGAALAAAMGGDIIIMDDGLQNPSLRQDVRILVADGGYGFGNGRVMPAGPLRESLDMAAPLTAAIVIGADETEVAPLLARAMPVARAHLVPGTGSEAWGGRRVFAFAGIGRPQKFFATLTELGAVLTGTASFADHHRYSAAELERLRMAARAASAALVTTEKDWVRLAPEQRGGIAALPVALEWSEGGESIIMDPIRALLHNSRG